MKNTIQELNVHLSEKQQGMINTLVEDNPILASIPVKPATHGIYNVYGIVTDIKGMDEVDYDDELPAVDISFSLDRIKLGKIGGKMYIPQDAAREMGGYTAYLDAKLPGVIAKSGNDQEYRIYYSGFLKSAINNKTAVSCGGKTANKQYSLVAVTYDMDSTVGLYNPKTYSNGKIFEQLVLNGGNEYEIIHEGKKFIGKGVATYMQFGLQLADPRNVAALVNIELGQDATNPEKYTGLPTIKQLDDLLTNVRASASRTVLHCHAALAKAIAAQYKLPRITITNGSTAGIQYAAYDWQGIPIVTSYNIAKGTEPVIPIA